MTNWESLKQSTPEFMASSIMRPNEMGLADIECDKSDTKKCYECCLNWLNAEVADGE